MTAAQVLLSMMRGASVLAIAMTLPLCAQQTPSQAGEDKCSTSEFTRYLVGSWRGTGWRQDLFYTFGPGCRYEYKVYFDGRLGGHHTGTFTVTRSERNENTDRDRRSGGAWPAIDGDYSGNMPSPGPGLVITFAPLVHHKKFNDETTRRLGDQEAQFRIAFKSNARSSAGPSGFRILHVLQDTASEAQVNFVRDVRAAAPAEEPSTAKVSREERFQALLIEWGRLRQDRTEAEAELWLQNLRKQMGDAEYDAWLRYIKQTVDEVIERINKIQ